MHPPDVDRLLCEAPGLTGFEAQLASATHCKTGSTAVNLDSSKERCRTKVQVNRK